MAEPSAKLLDRDEYVEQAYFFRALGLRMRENESTQNVLLSLREEILATTRLPLAIDFLAGELRLNGELGPAMLRLPHYFTAFQTFIVCEAEKPGGRFDFRIALEVLEREATFRASQGSPQGMFLFQFETICRNRLSYEKGLAAMALDPVYSPPWQAWVGSLWSQLGLVDLADLIYLRSEHLVEQRARQGIPLDTNAPLPLFGVREGKIALAHRHKDPLWLFATLERQLGYPVVPRPKPVDESVNLLPELRARVERLEARLRLVEEENRAGIDLSKFYAAPGSPPAGEGQ